LAQLLAADNAPTPSERYGLECLLSHMQELRQTSIARFHMHWHILQSKSVRADFEKILYALNGDDE
jgi:hypothetical protein